MPEQPESKQSTVLQKPAVDPELPVNGGLKQRDWVDLNHGGPQEEYVAKIGQYRTAYEGNPIALQQLDVFDPNSEYKARIREYNTALKSGDAKTQVELEAWFKEHYPDI